LENDVRRLAGLDPLEKKDILKGEEKEFGQDFHVSVSSSGKESL